MLGTLNIRWTAGSLCIFFATLLAIYDFHKFQLPFSTSVTVTVTTPPVQQKILEAPEEPKAPVPETISLHVGRGDTLARLMNQQSISRQEIHNAIQPLKKLYKPQNLRPNHEIEVVVVKDTPGAKVNNLLELRIRPSLDYEIIVKKNDDGSYSASKHKVELVEKTKWIEGSIHGSLYDAAYKQGVPGQTIHNMIMAYSYDVDFQRGLQAGDLYGILYSIYTDPVTGRKRPGDLIHATLTLNGKTYKIYSYQPNGKHRGYYNHKGESIRKGLLRTPVNGARLSSRFGRRRHPVLGYTKYHKGVDFAAPRGTPIMAAGAGVVEKVGRWGSYGHYVRIRHNKEYATAYAHLCRYAKGLKRGMRVTQGQVIGYIGSTGRATGPHLHYEVLRFNKHMNPLKLKMIPAAKLARGEMPAFIRAKEDIDLQCELLRREQNLPTLEVAMG